MRVLLIGAGGREHALAWKLKASPRLTQLFCAPGNAGIAELATCVKLDLFDHAAVLSFCRTEAIDFVIVGPEGPLVMGLVNDLEAAGVKTFGPTKDTARLEGSKGFTKDLCRAHAIPTAAYARFSSPGKAKAYVRERGAPIVIKADGLASGKGVIVAATVKEATRAIDRMFGGSLCNASEVVVEEMLVGEEASFFVLADGLTALPLATAQDHKRAFDGDKGPNTGGMGAYSPAPVMTEAMIARTLAEIIHPTLQAMTEMGCPFRGVLYAGLMITEAGPQLIEYNVRFGDPECQALMMRLNSDLLEALLATREGTLSGIKLDWSAGPALTVVMAAKGYPGLVETGTAIRGLEAAATDPDVAIFHAGTARRDGVLVATGGRVLGVTARGANIVEAREKAYAAVDCIDWPEGFCRRDIGWQAIGRKG